jgi:hypothetical protein
MISSLAGVDTTHPVVHADLLHSQAGEDRADLRPVVDRQNEAPLQAV